MITRLLSSKSLLNQFLVFNLMAFLILGFFTFLYLLAIEPELINKTSKKHQNIISNIESNLKFSKTIAMKRDDGRQEEWIIAARHH